MSCIKKTALRVTLLIGLLFLFGTIGAFASGIGIKCFCLLICDMTIFEAITIYQAALLKEYHDTKHLPHICYALTAMKFLYLLGAFVCFDENYIGIHLAAFGISLLIHQSE